ncbi:MAG TPA: transcriptional repressor [Solirubrobacteraceae bacterium]|nr:transcriptional repressor [Solirubrobacteraceae bacterium]
MSTDATSSDLRQGRALCGRTTARASQAAGGWAERAAALLRSAGFRGGGARSALLALLARESCALTVPEIEGALSRSGRAVSRASIYRILDQLIELGLVVRVATAGTTARYERAREGSAHHHHLFCEQCGAVRPFADMALERAISALSERLPYTVSGHEIQLWGTCMRCSPPNRRRAAGASQQAG